VKKEPEFSELMHVAIRPEMLERLNRLNRDKCSGFAKYSDLVRYLLDDGLTRLGYPSPQAQAAPQPFPQMQSPFQAPMNGGQRANP